MRWDYRVIAAYRVGTRSHDAFLAELQSLGDDGWEVVGTFPSWTSSGGGDVILKRPRDP